MSRIRTGIRIGRRGRAVRAAIGLVATVCLGSGCIGPGNRQTLRFDLAHEAGGEEVTERHWYFLWGLVPTVRSDVLQRCPTGVVAIREAPGEQGAIAWLPTLGLWGSRSTTYVCRAQSLPASR